MEALWGCASQLWVPGRSRVHGRLYLSFCSITLLNFGSVQIDAEFKKEHLGTHWVYCLGGDPEGGFGGWVAPQECPP